jgi:hypothetical protein
VQFFCGFSAGDDKRKLALPGFFDDDLAQRFVEASGVDDLLIFSAPTPEVFKVALTMAANIGKNRH